MSTVSPSMRTLALRLHAPAAIVRDHWPQPKCHEVLRACEPLRVPLTRLAGSTGYESLLRRAIAMSCDDYPALRNAVAGPDGAGVSSWIPGDGLDAAAKSAEAGADEVGLMILARLLGLLNGLIGEPLMLRLVREGWPRVSLDGWTSNEGSK